MAEQQVRGELPGSPRPFPIKEKMCADCGRTLPASEFWVRRRYQSGEPRSLFSYCKDCNRERSRFWDRQRRRRLGMSERKTGPHKGPLRYFQDIPQKKPKRAPDLTRVVDGPYKERASYNERVSAAPFVAWLEKWLAAQDDDGSQIRLALAAGVDEKRLRAVRDQESVTIGFIDRILIASGTDTQLWELVPDD